MLEDDIVLDIDETDEIKNKIQIDCHALIDRAARSIDDGKVYVHAMHFCINNNENDQHDIVVMRRSDFMHLVGADTVLQYRKEAAESHEFKHDLEKLACTHMKSLDSLAKDKNLTASQRNVILKAVDAIWNAVIAF